MQPWAEFWGMWLQVMIGLGGFALIVLLFIGTISWFSRRSYERARSRGWR